MTAPETSLQETIAAFDETLAADQGTAMGDFFTEDARLMWPNREDICGREAIRAALEDFISGFSTIAWQPERQLLEQHGRNAYTVGRFLKVRRRDNGQVEQIYGRLVEVWRREKDDQWRLAVLLSSRFGETEILGRE